MKKHEIVPQTMNEIECLNEIVELNDLDLEMISGGIESLKDCTVKCNELCLSNSVPPTPILDLPTTTPTLELPSRFSLGQVKS